MCHEGSEAPCKSEVWERRSPGKMPEGERDKGEPLRDQILLCRDSASEPTRFPCQIAEIVKAGGHLCLFLPKYHCELNIIEFFWGATKNHTRECCDFTLDGLDREIRIGQEKVKIATIRRWYHRMMRWVDAYETGAGTVTAQQQVQEFSSKKLKSHRRAPEDDGT